MPRPTAAPTPTSEPTITEPDRQHGNDAPNGVATSPAARPAINDDDQEPTQAVPTVSRVGAPIAPARPPVEVPIPSTLRGTPNPDIAELLVRPASPTDAAHAEPTPVAAKPKRTISLRRPRPRVRRVRRVVRSIDTWTVFKVSILFYVVAYAVLLVAGVLLWNLAYTTGTIENIQEFFKDFGWNNYQFYGDRIFHASWIVGMFLVVAGTGLNVTLAVLFNLISDLVGGIGVTVLEEEVRVVPIENSPNPPRT